MFNKRRVVSGTPGFMFYLWRRDGHNFDFGFDGSKNFVLILRRVVCFFQVKENHRQEEKAFKDFSDFVERTSDYTVLTVSQCDYFGRSHIHERFFTFIP